MHAEILRIAEPMITSYVDKAFKELEENVTLKTAEIFRDVEAKVLLTFHFQEEQAAAHPALSAAVTASEPSPPASSELQHGLTELLEGMKNDYYGSELCSNMQLPSFEEIASGQGFGCEGYSDSGYSSYFSSSDGFQESFGGYDSHC